MVRLRDEHNLETLRQISILLDNENKRLTERIQKLTLEIACLRGLDDKQRAQLELSLLQELEQGREKLFRFDESKSEGDDANESKKKKPPKEPKVKSGLVRKVISKVTIGFLGNSGIR